MDPAVPRATLKVLALCAALLVLVAAVTVAVAVMVWRSEALGKLRGCRERAANESRELGERLEELQRQRDKLHRDGDTLRRELARARGDSDRDSARLASCRERAVGGHGDGDRRGLVALGWGQPPLSPPRRPCPSLPVQQPGSGAAPSLWEFQGNSSRDEELGKGQSHHIPAGDKATPHKRALDVPGWAEPAGDTPKAEPGVLPAPSRPGSGSVISPGAAAAPGCSFPGIFSRGSRREKGPEEEPGPAAPLGLIRLNNGPGEAGKCWRFPAVEPSRLWERLLSPPWHRRCHPRGDPGLLGHVTPTPRMSVT